MSKDNFLLNKFKIFGTIFVMLFLLCALLPLGGALSIEAKSMESEMTNSVEVESDENTLVSTSGASTLYIDPESKYGGADTNDGLTPNTPIQTLDRAKELVSSTGSIYIMSTFYITEDTVVDMNSSDVTFKRYKPEDPTIFQNEEWYNDGVTFFEGDVFVIGDESDASISPTVVFDNFTFDGEGLDFVDKSSENGDVIQSFNSSLIFNKGFSVLNHIHRVVNLTGSHLIISGSSFVSSYGGTVHFSFDGHSIVVIEDIYCNIINIDAYVFNCIGSTKLVINDGEFTGLNATPRYEHVYIRVSENSEAVINGGKFHDNKGNGTVLVITDSNVTINGGRFYDNARTIPEAVNDWVETGCLKVNYGGNLTINGGIFENNSTINGGGVIAIGAGNANLTIKGGIFRNNSAAVGGVIYCNLRQYESNSRIANISISNAQFINNTVKSGAYTPSKYDNYDCTGTLSGGSVIFTTQAVTISNCIFEGNVTEATSGIDPVGGAIMYKLTGSGVASDFGRNDKINIYDSTFIDNQNLQTGTGFGGALSMFNQIGGETVNCLFEGNSCANVSGAVYGMRHNYEYRNCRFTENSTAGRGGVSYRDGTFIDCLFRRNKASGNGGALYAQATIVDNCVFEENYAATNGGAIYVGAYVVLSNSTIQNNVAGGNGGGLIASGSSVNTIFYGQTIIFGNCVGAELDENDYPVIQEGELVGGTQNNYAIAGGVGRYAYFVERFKGSKIGISAPGFDNGESALLHAPLGYGYTTSNILNVLVSDDPSCVLFYKNPQIFMVQTLGQSGDILYSASDFNGIYDGQEHSIDIETYTSGASVKYSLDEGDNKTYVDTKPTFVNVGIYTVYYEITASGYTTVTGSRQVFIKENSTSLVDFAERSGEEINILTTVQLYYGESLTTTTDLTDRIKAGVIKDQNGNSVHGTFTANGSYNVTFDTATISVRFTPTNTEAYVGCTFTARVEFKYDELYFINGAFYLNADATGVSIPKSVGLNKILSYMSSQGKIYFSDTYNVTSSETIATDKLIYLYRYTWRTSGVADEQVFTGAIFNVSSGRTLTIGAKNRTDNTTMLGKIIIDGQGYATAGSTNALIVNNGTLTIYGGLEIKGGYNINSIGPVTPAGAIYNTGTMNLYDVYISDCRYLNYTASTQFSGGGGGIFNTGTARIVNGSIKECIARGGGAIYSEGTLDIINTTFVDNSAYSGTQVGTSSSSGMTIKLANGEANLVNILITRSRLSNGTTYYTHTSSNMTAEKLGGGIYVGVNASLVLVSSALTECYGYQGGGVYVDGTAHIFDSMVSSCYTTNGGEGVAVGTQGELTVVDLFIARCSSTNTPDGSLGTNENGILTLTGGNTSLLSLSFEAGEGLNGNTNNSGENNQDYVLGVILAVVTLVLISSILLILSTKSKKAKVRLKK